MGIVSVLAAALGLGGAGLAGDGPLEVAEDPSGADTGGVAGLVAQGGLDLQELFPLDWQAADAVALADPLLLTCVCGFWANSTMKGCNRLPLLAMAA